MKKKVRRIISAVLAVVMLCGIIPANATVSKAATTANVSLSSLGRKGTVGHDLCSQTQRSSPHWGAQEVKGTVLV